MRSSRGCSQPPYFGADAEQVAVEQTEDDAEPLKGS
jgi:hypothetical protein